MQNKKTKIIKALLLSLMAFELFAASAFAVQAAEATPSPYRSDYDKSGVENSIKEYLCTPGNETLFQCINKMYRVAIAFGSVIAVFFIVIAGYVYMSDAGEGEGKKKGKDILVSSITGLVLLYGGYVLLRYLNPDIVTLQPIQPPDIKEMIDSGTKGKPFTANNDPARVQPGCTFQNAQARDDIKGLQPDLFNVVVKMCESAKGKGPIQISFVAGGTHSENSYHYKYCAVDFAAGDKNFRKSPAGVAAEAEANRLKGTTIRINPGSDATAMDHIHVDIAGNCNPPQ